MRTIRCLAGALSPLACAQALAHHEAAAALPVSADDLGFGALLGVAALTAAIFLHRAANNAEDRR